MMLSGPSNTPHSVLPYPGKLLALDVGQARIGLATCDPLQLAVQPLTVLHRTSRRADFAYLALVVRQEGIAAIVCGLPLNQDGSDSPQTQWVREWALRLAQALRAILGQSIPILFWDEHLSTFAAQEFMTVAGRAHAEDAVAAAIILQNYLDAQRRNEPLDYGRIELPMKAERKHGD
jgi:putative holliday junction resolvase